MQSLNPCWKETKTGNFTRNVKYKVKKGRCIIPEFHCPNYCYAIWEYSSDGQKTTMTTCMPKSHISICGSDSTQDRNTCSHNIDEDETKSAFKRHDNSETTTHNCCCETDFCT